MDTARRPLQVLHNDGVNELTHIIIKKKICSINSDILRVDMLLAVEAVILWCLLSSSCK